MEVALFCPLEDVRHVFSDVSGTFPELSGPSNSFVGSAKDSDFLIKHTNFSGTVEEPTNFSITIPEFPVNSNFFVEFAAVADTSYELVDDSDIFVDCLDGLQICVELSDKSDVELPPGSDI